MEAVVESLELALKVSNEECHEDYFEDFQHRIPLFKSKPNRMSQAERRKQYLELQKKRRYDYQNYCRKLADPDSHSEDVEKCENIQEDMEWDTSKKKTGPTYKNQIMLSEWLIEMPEDFDSNWLIVPCPQGKRCLMVASRACTKVFSKSGFLITKFQSLLPGGHFQSPSDNTILDCLWSEVKQCYYVLDILSWSGLPLLGCEAQFRFYWLKSKFNECPQLQLKSSRNVYPLIPLPSSSCVKENIETLMMMENQMWNPLDGLLFYHKLGFYTPNVTPLVGWLKPFMIPEILGMKIPEFYAKAQPVNYVNIKEYLKKKPQKTLKEIFRVV